jgi:hypothetical protein
VTEYQIAFGCFIFGYMIAVCTLADAEDAFGDRRYFWAHSSDAKNVGIGNVLPDPLWRGGCVVATFDWAISAQLRGHGGPVRALAISADGKTAISGSFALKALDIVWTQETVSKLFEPGPATFTPGTKMPEQRIGLPAKRAALVKFLQQATKEK